MVFRSTLLGLGGVIFAGAASAQDAAELPAGDPEAGQQVAGMCRTCHGVDGLAQIPLASNIGGEPASYLARQLLAFRSGEREHEMMSVVASGLTDQQIADVAAWYGAHDVTVVPPPDDFNPAGAPELCSSCHGADGIALIENAPHLTGENSIYLENQLKAFRSGRREHQIMTPIASALSEGEMQAAAEWYAQFGLELTPPYQ